MAVVGSAQIIVRAITSGVKNDIQRGFRDVDRIGGRAGSSMGSAFSDGFIKESKGAYEQFRKLSAIGYITGPAIAGAASAISSLVSGLAAFAAQAATAAPAAVTLAGAFSALIQAGGSLKLALGGVFAAISAGLKDKNAIKDAKDLSNELNRVKDARRNLALAIERAGETEERVTRAVNDAWDSYQNSIIDTQRAIDDLRRAQKEAAEQTQQLGFDVEDAGLAQERAAMNLEDARRRLQSVSDLPPDSTARREAELAFQEADLNYRRAIDRNNDLRQQQEEANAAGSAGADMLVDASNKVQDAKDKEVQAFQNYQDAIVSAERARRDSARDIIRAEEEVARALEALKKAQDEAKKGSDAFRQAMKKLSPEARKFVRYIISLEDEFRSLRAAAGKNFFAPLTQGISQVVANTFPMLRVQLTKTGGALGSLSRSILDAFSRRRNLGALSRIMGTNADVIVNLGLAGKKLVTGFIQILDTARPLTRQLSQWAIALATGWRETLMADKKSGALSRTLNYAKQTATQLGQVFKNVVTGLINIGRAAAGPGSGGELLLDTLEAATRKFKTFTDNLNTNGTGAEYFRKVAFNFLAISHAIGLVVAGFVKLGDNAGVASFFATISKSGGAIQTFFNILERFSGDAIGKVMGEILNNILLIINAFSDTGSLDIFFGILKKATDLIVQALGNETVKKVIAFTASVHAATTALWLLSVPILFIGKVWIGAFLAMSGYIINIGKAAMFALTPVSSLNRAFNAMAAQSGAVGTLGAILGSIGAGPLLAIVAAIAALAAIFYLAYQNSEKLRNALSWVFDFVKSSFLSIWQELTVVFDQVSERIGSLLGTADGFSKIFQTIGDVLAVYIKLVVTEIMGIFKVVGAVLGNIVRIIGGVIGAIISWVKGFIEGVQSAVGVLKGAGGDAESFFDKVRKAIEVVWEVLSGAVRLFGSVMSYVFSNFVNPVVKFLGWLIGWLVGYFLKPWIAAFNWISSAVQDNWDIIVQAVENGVNNVIDFLNVLIDGYNKVAGFVGLEPIENLAKVDFTPTEEGLKTLNEELAKNEEVAKRAAYTNDQFLKILESTKTAALDVFDTFYAGRNVFVKTIKNEEDMADAMTNLRDMVKQGDSSMREMKIALFDMGQGYIDTARQAIESGKSTGKAVKIIRDGREHFLKGADAIGLTAKQAEKLANKMGLTPDTLKKTVETSGVDKLQDLNKQLQRLNDLTKSPQLRNNRFALSEVSEQRQILSAKIEQQMTIVFGKGQSRKDPLFVSVTNVDGNGDLTQMALGGVVYPRNGGSVVRVAEAGRPERVEPLDPDGLSRRDKALISHLSGANMTINVHPTPGMDERDLAAKISREIRSLMRKGAA